MTNLCSLCNIDLPSYAIQQEQHFFCCWGCHAVFNILSTKKELDGGRYFENPLFKQALQSGLISNPALLEQIRQNRPHVPKNELEQLHLEIADMWCPACSDLIRLLLLQEKGVQNCVVDYATDLAAIEYSPRYIAKEKLFALIESFGYHPKPLTQIDSAVSSSLYLRFIISAFCALNIMMFSYPLYAAYFYFDDQGYAPLFAWLSALMVIPVISYCCWPIFRRFLTSLKVGYLGMETLVILGVFASLGLSLHELFQGGIKVYFDSLSVIVSFVLLGKIIETKAKFSAKEAVFRLMRAMPVRGRKQLNDGSLAFVPLKEIKKEDILHVYQGEKIILDGVIVEGQGACDESLMTGEAIPVRKERGAPVLGGTILQQGSIAFKVSRDIEESALFKIVEIIQREIGHKSVYIRATDIVVRGFVPTVLLLASFSALFCFFLGTAEPGQTLLETSLIRAISVLLISCPCAIGIAVPLAESHVISKLASLGAIMRNRNCLTLLGKETVMVFDKTGTITEGCFRVLDGLQHLDAYHLSILKTITSKSNHAVSIAISKAIDAPLLSSISSIEEITGKGIRACHEGNLFFLGSSLFLNLETAVQSTCFESVECDDSLDLIRTEVFFADQKQCLTKIILGDRLREEASELIRSLNLEKIKTVLLSGDSEGPVAEVAKSCQFSEYYAQKNPLEKRELIESFREQGHIVCFVGDGINDALALNRAHIGVSVVSATDISIQVSDMLLTTDRLAVIQKMRKTAILGHRISKQNLFWAFFYNVLGLGLAMGGYLSPLFAAFAMVMSSSMVLVNARRIIKLPGS